MEVFMKKFISVILTVAMLAALCLTATSCGKDKGTAEGIYTDGDKTYFIANGGAITISGDTAAPTDTPTVEGEPESKVFDAPKTLDKEYFEYTTKNGGKYITGLTADGKSASVLIVPSDVAGIEAGAFSGSSLKSIVIAKGAKALNVANGAFKGTSGLSVYIACSTDNVTAGNGMLDDASGIKIIVTADQYSNFKSHYLFGTFADSMSKL